MYHHIELTDAYKHFTYDQDKVISPEQTVEQFRKKLEKINLDILDSTVRIDNGRLDIPVYFSVCGKDASSVTGTKKQMGKGGTPQQAEASAVMELTERFSFFSFLMNPQNFIMDTYENLKTRLPEDCIISFDLIARSVQNDSGDLSKAEKIFESIPMKWTWGYNLTRKKEVLIPFDWFFAINEFNGPSAGNCIEEALSQGICEIVERHVSSVISRNRLRVPSVSTDRVTDPLIQEMLFKYARAGVKLYISDFSLDTGIASIGVLAYDPATFPEKSEIVWTAGTTPDPRKALNRALTEVAQLAGDFNSASNYVASGLPKFSSLEDALFITMPETNVEIDSLPNLANDNIKVEVENLISELSKKNMEVITINITHPELEVPALYTIVPGAHFRQRATGTSVGMFSAKLIAEKQPPETALLRLLEIEELLPEKYYIKFYIGLSLVNLGDPEGALPYFQHALELEPAYEDIPSIYSYLGLCLKEMEQYKEALLVLKKGIDADPERTDIFNLMGFCHFKLKEHESAIDCFKNILKLNPSSAIDYANIASNYRDMGETEKAVRYYRIALDLDPSIDFARQNLENLTG